MTNCRFGMASMDWGLDVPDGTNPMSMFYSKSIGGANMSCYEDAVFDAAFEKALVMPPGRAHGTFPNDAVKAGRLCADPPAPDQRYATAQAGPGNRPFGTINDWLQILTLSVDASAQSVKSR